MRNTNRSNTSRKVEVSVIVPCYNEDKTITFLLDAILGQTFPITDLEVIIADGLSTDLTRMKIQDFSSAHKNMRIKVIDNPKRTIPAAINLAVKNAIGQFIVRLDAHSIPGPTYIELCINALRAGVADCVGGVWDIVPGNDGWIARSIAAAASNPIAVGDARYRFTKKAAFVDTVPFGAFSRKLFIKVGGFNEDLLTNEDYEFFARIRKNNGKIWLDPAIRCTYFARKDLLELIQQYWRYGFWKFRMLKNYPETLKWRQALPPLFVITVIVLILLSFFSKIFLWLLMGIIFLYLMIIVGSSIGTAFKKNDVSMVVGMPLSTICMQVSWGSGFLYSMIKK
jgi:succinoglycan biosynthesis protein ExoA